MGFLSVDISLKTEALMLIFNLLILFSSIRHTERVDPEDGSKRVRVRFNIEGPHGNAFVFAEVSSDMPSGEFVYGKFLL